MGVIKFYLTLLLASMSFCFVSYYVLLIKYGGEFAEDCVGRSKIAANVMARSLTVHPFTGALIKNAQHKSTTHKIIPRICGNTVSRYTYGSQLINELSNTTTSNDESHNKMRHMITGAGVRVNTSGSLVDVLGNNSPSPLTLSLVGKSIPGK